MNRTLYEDEHDGFRDSFRRFLGAEVVPHYLKWEKDGLVPHDVFERAGGLGFLGMEIPEELGGAGVSDFRFKAVISEEISRVGVPSLGIPLHNDVCVPYYLSYASEEQRHRWLPQMASGESVCAIAMTEPGVGSDLASLRTVARETEDGYVVNGSKIFITNGHNADLVITAVKTDPAAGRRGISLLVLERGMDGFRRGRNLEKIGQHAQDTAELFFDDVLVPKENLLGEAGEGFRYLMANLAEERLSLAIGSIASAEAAVAMTKDYVDQRDAFGGRLGQLQTVRFALAQLHTEIEITQCHVDRCILALNAGELSAVDAAKAKWACSELQGRVLDRCLQLHGGYGYMQEYPIARAFVDGRVYRIAGGASEVMLEIIARSMER